MSANEPMIGRKDDASKPRYDLVPVLAERAVVDVLTFGAKKYGDGNWRYVEGAKKRYIAAALRHIAEYRTGVVEDKDSGRSPLAHAVCSLMFIMELDEYDDSFGMDVES